MPPFASLPSSRHCGDDPTVLRCAAELLARLAHRVTNPPRLPSAGEARTIVWMRQSVSCPFEESTHEPLLRRLWSCTLGAPPLNGEAGTPYKRRSQHWCELGFQQKDPASDVRGGGALCLEALIWLAEQQPEVLLYLLEARQRREVERGPYSSFPIACAGIAIVRRLCEFFQAVAPGTGRPNLQVEHTMSSTWHLVGSRRHFMELFTAAFLHLDHVWNRSGASYMQFNQVFWTAMTEFLAALDHLPPGVSPSPLSFAPEAFLDALDTVSGVKAGSVKSLPRQQIADLLVSQDREGDDNQGHAQLLEEQREEWKVQEQKQWSLPPAPPSPTGLKIAQQIGADAATTTSSVDLLGLEALAEDLRWESQAATGVGVLGSGMHATSFPCEPEVEFFASFGLAD